MEVLTPPVMEPWRGFLPGLWQTVVDVRVDVPFHQLGRYKWKELGIPYTLEQTEPPTDDAVEEAVRLFRTEGLVAY